MSTNYQLWMTGNGSTSKMQFPVHPEQIEVSRGSQNESIKLTGVGEVTIIQKPAADRVNFSSFFPAAGFPGVSVALQSPITYIKKLVQWKNSGKPVRFVSTALSICDYYTIEQLDYYEQGGDVGTIYYTIELKLYREVSVRTVTVEEEKATVPAQEETPRVDNTEQPQTYTVKKGDCLWNIAKKFYGNGSRYTEIYEANKSLLKGRSPNMIYTGDVLVIP